VCTCAYTPSLLFFPQSAGLLRSHTYMYNIRVCVHVYVCVYMQSPPLSLSPQSAALLRSHVHICIIYECVCMCVCVYACFCVCVHMLTPTHCNTLQHTATLSCCLHEVSHHEGLTYIQTHFHTHTHTCMIHLCVCVRICVCVCVCVCEGLTYIYA